MAEGSVTDMLCNAAARGDLLEVQILLEKGADVNGLNIYNRTALQVVMLGNTPLVQVLLQAGADPNVRDRVLRLTVLHDTARGGFADSVRVLLEHEADANLADDHGNLPLHFAAREGHVEVIKLLIARTADPRTPNARGLTASELARQQKNTEAATFIDEYLRAH